MGLGLWNRVTYTWTRAGNWDRNGFREIEKWLPGAIIKVSSCSVEASSLSRPRVSLFLLFKRSVSICGLLGSLTPDLDGWSRCWPFLYELSSYSVFIGALIPKARLAYKPGASLRLRIRTSLCQCFGFTHSEKPLLAKKQEFRCRKSYPICLESPKRNMNLVQMPYYL